MPHEDILMPVVCVLRSGGDFRKEHVHALYRQVRQACRQPITFYCLTDEPFVHSRIICIKLRHNLPGWWSKMELFAHFEAAFYMDLDTVVLGDISDMLRHHRGFRALRDFGGAGMGSGVMSWGHDMADMYAAFMDKAAQHMAANRTVKSWGDQGFIQRYLRGEVLYFQDLYPNRFVSYKKDVRPGKPPADVVCFHGNPRPWQTDIVKTWGITYGGTQSEH